MVDSARVEVGWCEDGSELGASGDAELLLGAAEVVVDGPGGESPS
jgi:hypothetical protein